MSVNAESSDGAVHAIQLFTELASGKWAMFVAALQSIIPVSSEFVTGIAPEGDQGGGLVRWQTSRTATSIYHETEPESHDGLKQQLDVDVNNGGLVTYK